MSVCVWEMASPHGGEVVSRNMFSNQISVPVCDTHYNEHITLIALSVKFGKDVEQLLFLSSKEREDMLASLTNNVADVIKETALVDSSPYKAPDPE